MKVGKAAMDDQGRYLSRLGTLPTFTNSGEIVN